MPLSRRRFIQRSGAALLLGGGRFARTASALPQSHLLKPQRVMKPQIAGDWWTVATNPDLGPLTGDGQQPVDFGIWRAEDGTWQIWSCIRGTKEVGYTRLLYRWEGAALTDTDWTPKGIAMRADPALGEQPGGLQAPYVFRDGSRFVLFYGSWNDICSADGSDGKTFQRLLNAEGKSALFGSSDGNVRDPMVIRIGGLWHCYYSANYEDHGRDYCRTSPNLRDWGPAQVVADGGQAGTDRVAAECPFVAEPTPGKFYLFRTQRYGQTAQTSVYFSQDPLDFGVNNDSGHFVCTLPLAAPEIFQFKNQWYIAALLPNLTGIHLSSLHWS